MIKGLHVIDGSKRLKLKDIDPADPIYDSKEDAIKAYEKWAEVIGEEQRKLTAQHLYAVVLGADGRDAAGKSTLGDKLLVHVHAHNKHIVANKAPQGDQLLQDFLRRYSMSLPLRGHISFYDRTPLEELSTVRVHQNYLKAQNLPVEFCGKDIWDNRAEDMRAHELYLHRNGFLQIYFYMHMSKEVQEKRLRERILESDHNYKFSEHDIVERGSFHPLQDASELAINQIASPHAVRIILPADKKWASRALAAEYVAKAMRNLHSEFPEMKKKVKQEQLQLLVDSR